MAFTYQQIIDRAETLLQDESAVAAERRWTETELLDHAKEGEHEIVRLKPDVNVVIESVQLSSGSQQSLPSLAIQLMDVLSNMGTDGSTRGAIISFVDRKIMDAINPSWMTDSSNTTVKHVIYDPKRTPKSFWVYPQSDGTNYIEIATSKLPDNSSKVIGDTVLIADEYATALKHFIVAQAYAKDIDVPGSTELFQAHFAYFMESLGMRDSKEEEITPRRDREVN